MFSKGSENENWPQRLKRAEALIKEIELEEKKGETLNKSEVQYVTAKVTNLLFSLLERLANVDLPVELKGLDERAIQIRLLKAIENLKRQFREGLGPLLASDAEQLPVDNGIREHRSRGQTSSARKSRSHHHQNSRCQQLESRRRSAQMA